MKFNKTKIIATLGPSSTSKTKIKSLIQAGVNVFRVNFSHAIHSEIKQTVKDIREVSSLLNRHISILGDLQGPKIRLGIVEEGAVVKKSDTISITTKIIEKGNSTLVSINYPDFPKDVSENEIILIDDGKLILKVVKTNNVDLVEAKVVQGGALKSKKGVNLPDSNLKTSAISSSDKKYIKIAANLNVDWIALSFVQKPSDIKELKKLCDNKISIMAKIEKPSALKYINEIC